MITWIEVTEVMIQDDLPIESSVLVTGGVGFIGSDLVKKLDDLPSIKKVFVLDAFTYASDIRRLDSVSTKVEIINGDVRNSHKYKSIFRECAYVVHMAAESHVDRSISSGVDFVLSNVQGSFAVLEACREFPSISLVMVSTDEVYGSIREGESTESDNLYPSSPYSASKASADLLTLANFHTHKQRVLITRCTNNLGPYQNREKFIPTIVNNALTEIPIPIYGNGLNQREWIYVSDHCDAILAAMFKFKSGEIFNIGSGYRVSNVQVVKDILRILGRSENLIEYVADRKGHDFRYALDSSKFKRHTGWFPRFTYETALLATVNWYQKWFLEKGEVY